MHMYGFNPMPLNSKTKSKLTTDTMSLGCLCHCHSSCTGLTTKLTPELSHKLGLPVFIHYMTYMQLEVQACASLFHNYNQKKYWKLYFKLIVLPLIEAGIFSIKSWSLFGSASLTWTVCLFKSKRFQFTSSLIVTAFLVTFIVDSGMIQNWNSKER